MCWKLAACLHAWKQGFHDERRHPTLSLFRFGFQNWVFLGHQGSSWRRLLPYLHCTCSIVRGSSCTIHTTGTTYGSTGINYVKNNFQTRNACALVQDRETLGMHRSQLGLPRTADNNNNNVGSRRHFTYVEPQVMCEIRLDQSGC